MDQADRLRALASAGESIHGTRVISVTSGKGGVGKTNVAVNLATSFARRGLKVLLIDADFGLANANLLLGVNPEKSLDDVMFGSAKLSEIFVTTRQGFDLVPSSSGLRQMLDMDPFMRRALMDQLFQEMRNYQIVIYDTAPGLGRHVLDFNSASHDIVVVSLAEPTSLADSYALIKVLATERREKRFKLLVNRVRNATEGLESFRKLTSVSDEFLNISVDFLGTLPEDTVVSTSSRFQVPVLSQAPKSAWSVSLDRIADKLLASAKTGSQKKLWIDSRSLEADTGSLP